jgi:hypothetical protein
VKRDYQTLDAVVVIGSLTIVGGGCVALALVKIPSENLAVLAGLLGTIAGTILGGYAGFRWGASVAQKTAPDTAKEAANRVAEAADTEADVISGTAE